MLTFYVENYFHGFQLITFDGRLFSWWDRETQSSRYELTTLGL